MHWLTHQFRNIIQQNQSNLIDNNFLKSLPFIQYKPSNIWVFVCENSLFSNVSQFNTQIIPRRNFDCILTQYFNSLGLVLCFFSSFTIDVTFITVVLPKIIEYYMYLLCNACISSKCCLFWTIAFLPL